MHFLLHPHGHARVSGLTPTLVIGLGNRARGDDGFGAAVLAQLGKQLGEAGLGPTPELDLVEAGLAGLDLVLDFQGRDSVFLVDAVQMGRVPGAWRRIPASELLATAVDRGSLHGFGLATAVRLAEALGVLPRELWLFGVQPSTLGYHEQLSPEVQAAIVPVTNELFVELDERGLLQAKVAG